MTRRSRSSTKKSTVVRLDLSDVESRARIKAGEYDVEVAKVEKAEGNAGDYLKWEFKITDGDCKGAPLYYNTSLTPQSLWNLRGLLEELEVEIPDDEFDLDLEELEGSECRVIVELEDEGEYKGKPRVVDFEPLEADAGKKSEKGEKDSKGKDSKGKKGKELDPMTQDEINDMSQEELETVIEEYSLSVDLDDYKTLRKMKTAVIDAMEEEGHLKED